MNQRLPEDLRVLLQAPTAFQANILVALLSDEGITAMAVEETLVGALNPSSSKTMVLVREVDLTRAHFAIDHARHTAKDLDWSKIDVGDESEETTAELAAPQAGGERKLPPIIFVLAILGVLLIVAGIAACIIALLLPVPNQ